LENTSKVMIDVDGGNNLMYLPLDKLIGSETTPRRNRNKTTVENITESFSDEIEINKDSFNTRKRNLYNE